MTQKSSFLTLERRLLSPCHSCETFKSLLTDTFSSRNRAFPAQNPFISLGLSSGSCLLHSASRNSCSHSDSLANQPSCFPLPPHHRHFCPRIFGAYSDLLASHIGPTDIFTILLGTQHLRISICHGHTALHLPRLRHRALHAVANL